MMKLKTKKAAAKRFSFTATGKVKFKRTNKRHNLGNKSAKRKLNLRGPGYA
ncbi:MAG: 50S ribosomal protein L35, partial [Proteobacteria bacterium]